MGGEAHAPRRAGRGRMSARPRGMRRRPAAIAAPGGSHPVRLRAGAGPHRAGRHRHAARLRRARRLRRLARQRRDPAARRRSRRSRALLAAWRARGWPIVHTREAHRPDLADCPPAKRLRGAPGLRIGDPGPMGRLLVAGEPGADIIAALAPLRRRARRSTSPARACSGPRGLHEMLQARRHHATCSSPA